MYEKVKNFTFKFLDKPFKPLLIIWVILFILSIILVTVEQKWPSILTYPEDAYQALEDEAKRMAETHNLETEYTCYYEYNNESNFLSLNLSDYTGSNNISITARIAHYGSDNQEITIEERNKNKFCFILINLLSFFVILPVTGSLAIGVILALVLPLVVFIAFILHKIKERILKSKE